MHKRIWGSISRRPSQEQSEKALPNGDSPEANVARGIRLFCESGGLDNSGEEVLNLPIIVEAAESSPSAASEAAIRIRKFLSKDYHQRAYVQYNAIMLVRILADNPGKSFTKNLDQKFVSTVKELLRHGTDLSVQQILRETLDSFEANKADDETLAPLRDMWKKERAKVKVDSRVGPVIQQRVPGNVIAPAYGNHDQQNYFARNHKPQGLPSPVELAQRVEEAKTSAKLLSQVVQSTPPTEVLGNELIREFVERCQSASRSMQHYIHADNPPPDEDTLLTLIETNDQLATAMSRHQRALLQARRVTGVSPPPPTNGQSGPFQTPAIPPSNSVQQVAPPPGPPPRKQVPQPGNQDPFGDENETKSDVHGSTAPPSHGLPPPGIWSQKQSPSSLPGSGYEASPNNMGRQDPPTNDTTRHKVDADEEQEVNRQPVKYRF